jgi:hypothetical protein
VANGTGRSGVARATTDELLALGWALATPSDAISDADLTTIYYREGFAAAASQLSIDLGFSPAGIAQLAVGQSVSDADDGSDVIALLGADFGN